MNSLAREGSSAYSLTGVDSGNEHKVFLVVFCDPFSADGRIHVGNDFLTVRRLKRANAEGLMACLRATMGFLVLPIGSLT